MDGAGPFLFSFVVPTGESGSVSLIVSDSITNRTRIILFNTREVSYVTR
jgi:hypothetical protein